MKRERFERKGSKIWFENGEREREREEVLIAL